MRPLAAGLVLAGVLAGCGVTEYKGVREISADKVFLIRPVSVKHSFNGGRCSLAIVGFEGQFYSKPMMVSYSKGDFCNVGQITQAAALVQYAIDNDRELMQLETDVRGNVKSITVREMTVKF